MEQDAPQDVYAEEHVARALSLAATILEASPRGLTKAEIWERIELYPREVSTAEEKEAREKVFDRDKKYLSQNGIRLIRSEGSSEHEHRYAIDPEDYGLPELELTPGELMLLRQLQQVWRGTRARASILQAVGALTGYAPAQDRAESGSATAVRRIPAPLGLGDDRDFDHLEALARLGRRPAVSFGYTARGRFSAEARRVVVLGVGVRGHWYLTGYDLDRRGLRTYRLDRIRGTIAPLRDAALQDPGEEEVLRQIRAGELLGDFDLDSALDAAASAALDPQIRAEAALAAHRRPPRHPGRLRPIREGRRADPAPQKVERLLSMTVQLHRTGGVRTRELLESYGITAKQLQRDLLSLQQSGSYGADRFGSLFEVHPVVPLTTEEFLREFVEEDALISLEVPEGALRGTMTRPVSLSLPAALSLSIAAESLEPSAEAASLREKLRAVLPEQLGSLAGALSLAGSGRSGAGDRAESAAEQLGRALETGRAAEILYEDAEGRSSRRRIGPANLFRSGPHRYLRAWDRGESAARIFRLSRIREVRILGEQAGEQAGLLVEEPLEPPRVPEGEQSLRAVLHFSAPVAAEADDYEPELHRLHEDGARTVQLRFRSEESLIRLCAGAGGDVVLLEPEELRERVIARAEELLSPPEDRAE